MISKSKKLFVRCNQIEGVDLTSKSRRREHVAQRKAFMVLCFREFNQSDTLQYIGELIGVDHSTVHHHNRTDHWVGSKGYTIENYYYNMFRKLIKAETESDRIRANMLIGFL
jgi:hypothetical protein